MGKLITPSVLNAVDWAKNAPDSVVKPDKGGDGRTTWKEKALEDLRRQLSRDYSEPMPSYVQRGIDFENAVYRCARMDEDNWEGSELFREVVSLCRGGRFQAKAKKNMTVDGVVYTLYGKLDVDFPQQDFIRDLKATGSYKAPQHFLSTPQHLIYSWATGRRKFEYRVVVFADEDQPNKITEHYGIPWETPGHEEVGAELARLIRGFREDLETLGMTDLYLSKFCLF